MDSTGENASEMASRIIASRRSMSTDLWTIHGFDIGTMLPLDVSFNASWFVDQNLISLLDRFWPGGWE
jgi:hypothetical protein